MRLAKLVSTQLIIEMYCSSNQIQAGVFANGPVSIFHTDMQCYIIIIIVFNKLLDFV